MNKKRVDLSMTVQPFFRKVNIMMKKKNSYLFGEALTRCHA